MTACARSPRGRWPATSALDAATCRNARRETCLLHVPSAGCDREHSLSARPEAIGAMSRFGLECGRRLGQMSRQRIRYVKTSDGVRLAWAEAGHGPDAGQGDQLADTPRVRVGEPGLASLDPLLLRPLPVRALRRARVRDDRLERSGSVSRAAALRSGSGRRCGGLPRTVHAARHLAGRRPMPPLHRTAS